MAHTNSYDLIYNWFDHLKSKGNYITGYMIMPNKVHALIGFRNTGQSINTVVGNGKRFIAYEIIKRRKKQGEATLLHQLHLSVDQKIWKEIKSMRYGKIHLIGKNAEQIIICNRNLITCMITLVKGNGALPLRRWSMSIVPQSIISQDHKEVAKCLIFAN